MGFCTLVSSSVVSTASLPAYQNKAPKVEVHLVAYHDSPVGGPTW